MNILHHKKKIFAAILSLCVGCAWSCVAAIPNQAPPMVPERSAWAVYWDWERGLDAAARGDEQALVAFAAHFDRHNHPVLAEGLDVGALSGEAALKGRKLFLSFVNDKDGGRGQALKDVELLHKLLDKEYARRQHIEEILDLCVRNHFAGVEIDYENVWQDEKLVENFAAFISELKEACALKELRLRVVLEPKTLPYAEMLPEKIEYVVMFYNLYGTHSGPGPKADEKFILRTLKQMEKLRGTPTIAFANGGFDWTAGGRTDALTSEEAEALARRYAKEPERDKKSRALYFAYEEKGREHEVWYADTLTLAFWRGIAEKYGYQRFSLWRL